MTTSPFNPTQPMKPEDLVAVSKHWGVLLSFGLIFAGLGAAVLAWPDKSVTVAAVLMAISLLVSGLFGLVASFTQPDRTSISRVLMAISGALSIALGLAAFQGVTQAIAILVLIVGIGWVMRGIIDLVAGLQAKGVPGRGLTITSGVLGLFAGAAILVWPGITLTVLCWIVGLTLLVLGLVQVVGAFTLRSTGARLAEEAALGAGQPRGTVQEVLGTEVLVTEVDAR